MLMIPKGVSMTITGPAVIEIIEQREPEQPIHVVPHQHSFFGGHSPVPAPIGLQSHYAGWGGYAPVSPEQVGQMTPTPRPYVSPPPMLPHGVPMLVPPPIAPPVNRERINPEEDPHVIAMRGYIAARERQIAEANKRALEIELQQPKPEPETK